MTRHARAHARTRTRTRVGRLPALGAAAALLVAGGSGLLAMAFQSAPAAADSSGSSTTGTALGGYTITSLAEAVTAQYEQPNFPVPATPSLELDEGYASTEDNSGPTGSATASTLYPGQVVANSGPQLALLAPGARVAGPGHQRVPRDAQLGQHRQRRREHGHLVGRQRQYGQRHHG
jgi:hypothetical protein